MQLHEKIAELRKKKNMTQEQLAEACSVSAQAVSKWENGITSPDISLLPRLAELFGVTVDELLGVQKAVTVAVDPASVDLSKLLLRVRVLSAGGDEVNVNLPFSVAEMILKNEKFMASAGGGKMKVLQELDLAQIVSLVRSGVVGKLVEIKSADGDKVEVWVE